MKKNNLLILFLVFMSGCSPAIPYTKAEKVWLGAALSGQIADYASTKSAMGRGCSEGNTLMYGNAPSTERIMATKIATGGLIWWAANNMSHDNRAWFLPVASVIGWGPAAYNMTCD